jgi:hypothetical protein
MRRMQQQLVSCVPATYLLQATKKQRKLVLRWPVSRVSTFPLKCSQHSGKKKEKMVRKSPGPPLTLLMTTYIGRWRQNVTTLVMKTTRREQLRVSRIEWVGPHNDLPHRSFSKLDAVSVQTINIIRRLQCSLFGLRSVFGVQQGCLDVPQGLEYSECRIIVLRQTNLRRPS